MEIHNFENSDYELIENIAVDESSISDLFSHHIRKTIFFLLIAATLLLTWYLISGLALAMQISLAVVFLIFIVFLITDEKKIFSHHQNKYFVV